MRKPRKTAKPPARARTVDAKGKRLIVVESPAKTRTLERFLGDQYAVIATMGHIRDLPAYKLGVSIDNGFHPEYVELRDKKDAIAQLRKAVKAANSVTLACDPDREGEAICWHVKELLDLKDPARIEFNEITERAVTQALAHPRTIDMRRVDAQQARRILDRIVGYTLSPLLWKKIQRGLSAGRVQSVAVKLVVDRERDIAKFTAQEYWTIQATLTPEGKSSPFPARLLKMGGEKAEIVSQDAADSVCADLRAATFTVENFTRGERRRRPRAPFTTSTLQQAASRALGMRTKRTMSIAQQLYEGVELKGEGHVGLITYMRTDSPRVAQEAQAEARAVVTQAYGADYLPDQPPHYRSRKGAQDAHEAIRPTSAARTPESLQGLLSKEQLRLYELIWVRFLASQMAEAVYDTTAADITAGKYQLRASGSQLRFPGFLAVEKPETVASDEQKEEGDGTKAAEAGEAGEASEEGEFEGLLPEMQAGDRLTLLDLLPEQHFTEPPPRYTEATLVRALEARGIGRPSTYAPTVSLIQDRGYVESKDRRLYATDLGQLVTQELQEHFPNILDEAFTAQVEERLDRVEEGEESWEGLLREFYQPFRGAVETAKVQMQDRRPKPIPTEEVCQVCGAKMVIRSGRFGQFLSCSRFPECKGSRPLPGTERARPAPEVTDVACELCGKPMVKRFTPRRGGSYFLGCSGYPKCKSTKPLPKDSAAPGEDKE